MDACRICGCTETSPCRLEIFDYVPCWWTLPGICSACVGMAALIIERAGPEAVGL